MTYEEYVTSQNQKEMEKAADTITPVEMKEGDLVPDWTLKDADGKEISLSSLRGKPVILDFWGTWCIWCVVAMPKIEAVYQEFGDKIHIYGISCREPEGANPKEFLKEKKVSYPTLVDGDKVAQLLNVQGYPTLYVIGKDGKLLYQHSGYDKELDKNLTKILKENL
jgi:thiol-disulfide isomerase/thioredoxin